jgi:flavin reductase (DIM6/NTAB) family NADH-FMN oxidoreductase RutF
VDLEAKKKALRKFSYGLYVVTAKSSDDMAAGTVTWLSQSSFTPPLVVVAVRNDSHLHALVEQTRAMAISVVGAGQEALASAFFRASKVEGGRMNGYSVQFGQETGAPIIEDAPAWLEVRVTDSVARGDHTVYVAEVVNAGLRDEGATPLVLGNTEWTYGG